MRTCECLCVCVSVRVCSFVYMCAGLSMRVRGFFSA